MNSLQRLMARTGIAALVALSACGGGDSTGSVAPPTTTPPTPPPAPVATALILQSGDGQQAEIGKPLALRPTVLVRDASGSAMPGVAVTFAVDSGGGSLAATAAVTGADGTASSGVWTLGTNLGANVVSATVTGIQPVRFRAVGTLPSSRTLIDTQTVSPNGGTLRYTKPGDPLNGLSINIPARSFPTATRWTVRADSTIAVPLPADFSQIGPVLVIANGQNYADSAMMVTTPMRVASTIAVAPFYFDQVTGALEPIPLVDRTDSSATFGTRHFSNDMLALPRNAPAGGALRTSRSMSFGTVNIVWVGIPRARLIGSFSSSFRPGADDWEFINYGDYINANGNCEGMSITAMYYHYFVREGGGAPLYHRFDQSLPNQVDNVQGIRFVGSVQGDYAQRWYAGINQIQTLIDEGIARGATVENFTSTFVLLTLKLTQHPVLLSLRNANKGHAVVVYAATSTGPHTELSFADPNFPGTVRRMSFESGILTPVSMQTNATVAAESYDRPYALGVSAEVPVDQISRRWAEFTQKKAGTDRYPTSYRHEVYNALTDRWSTLGDTVRTTSDRLEMRFICNDCPLKTVGGVPDEQVNEIWTERGDEIITNKSLDLSLGTTRYIAVAKGYNDLNPSARSKPGFIDAKPFTVIARIFKLTAEQTTAPADVDLDFTALPAGIGGANPKFRWDFGDGSAALLKTGDSTATHRWSRNGKFTVKVELSDASGTLVARAQVIVEINDKASFVWEFAAITQQNATLPAAGIGSLRADTMIFMRATQWMAGLRSSPSDYGLLIFGRPNGGAKCNAVAILQRFAGGAEDHDAPSTIENFGGIVGSCGDPDYSGNLNLGSLTNGPLTGLASAVPSPNVLVPPGGSINATNSAVPGQTPVLFGTFVLNVRYSTGIGTYTVAFSALRDKPD